MRYFKNTRPLVKDNIKFDYNREHSTGWFNFKSEVTMKDIPVNSEFILEYRQTVKINSEISSFTNHMVCFKGEDGKVCCTLDGSEFEESEYTKFLRIKII